jgi:ABC-type transport system involved in cytochrome c biogenesis permease subunit
MKPRTVTAVVLAIITGVLMLFQANKSRPKEYERTYSATEVPPAWRPDVVDAFERIAIAGKDGRVKSLYTFAYYELLRTRGYASLSLKVEGEDRKRSWSPVEWMLDVLFYPELAAEYPVFIVEDSEVISRLGLKAHGKQRDRYTFNELKPGRDAMIKAAQALEGKKEEDLGRVERFTRDLASNFFAYEALSDALSGARKTVTVPADSTDESLKALSGQPITALRGIIAFAASPTWQALVQQRAAGEAAPSPPWMEKFVADIFDQMGAVNMLRWYPPTAPDKENWETVAGLVKDLSENGPHGSTAAAKLNELNELAALASDRAKNGEFQDRLAAFANGRIKEAKDTSHYGPTGLDRTYRRYHIFTYTTWFFLALFFIAAISWLTPSTAWLQCVLKWSAIVGYFGIAAGMTQRILITGWGPVTGIHETLPYITIIAGFFALFLTKFMKNPIPVSLAIVIGAAGMFFTAQHEALDSADTMTALVAVLRSNFWLWTHVTTINIGYATVLLGAFFSMMYIYCRVFDVMRTEVKLCRDLTRYAYGILCFGMSFSLFGTILGGIWGNDSWGRFWGWDPKENGAMLICVWCLFVMHMRLAGWIKEFGFHFWNAAAAEAGPAA